MDIFEFTIVTAFVLLIEFIYYYKICAMKRRFLLQGIEKAMKASGQTNKDQKPRALRPLEESARRRHNNNKKFVRIFCLLMVLNNFLLSVAVMMWDVPPIIQLLVLAMAGITNLEYIMLTGPPGLRKIIRGVSMA